MAEADALWDAEALLWSAGLGNVRRFHGQPFWEHETAAADAAARLEGEIRLESVADHSWKVADGAALLLDHFPWLDRSRATEMALLHDKLELITGDESPIDLDASGSSTHAFNSVKAAEKAERERSALATYLRRLRPTIRDRQRDLFEELIAGESAESRFVKAVDKLASLTFVIQVRRGRPLRPEHAAFTLAYSGKCCDYFPDLGAHFRALAAIFEEQVGSAVQPEGGAGDHDTASGALRTVR